MRLHAPKNVTFWIALILVIIGIIARLVPLGVISTYFWVLILAGYILLALGVLLKGL
jgi:type IV secretory pathway TrbL component